MPSREEVQKEYDTLYKFNPAKWSNTDRSDFMIKVLENHMPNPETVVDVGCGIGVALENYHKHNPKAKLYGIDPSNEAIRLSKERVPYGHFTIEDEFDEIKQFDLVFCLGVAEHVEDPVQFLRGLKRKVKSGGVCYLEVPHNLLYSKGPETYRRLTTRSRQIEWHLPRKRWERMITLSGFEIAQSYTGLNATWEFIWVLK